MVEFSKNITDSPVAKYVQAHRFVQHILFWLATFVFMVIMLLQRSPEEFFSNVVKDLVHMGLTIVTVYINLRILFPRLFSPGKYLRYIGYLSGLITGIALLGLLINGYLPRHYHGAFIPSQTMIFMSYIFPQIFFVTLTMLLHLVKEWTTIRDLELRYKSAEQEKLKTQIHSLKAQINPHFLFNTLNNIYSHSLYNDPTTPQLILQLSDLMSYIIYDCEEDTVNLAQEMDFVSKYIALEKMRIDESILINVEFDSGLDNYTIAPLLLLPLIENVFKHALQVEPPHIYLDLKLRCEEDGQLHFRLENYIDEDEKSMERAGGIGLQNVQRRLELIYPHRHIFTTEITEGRFMVSLTIKPESRAK